MTGIIKRYDDKKRYGFIMPLVGKPDAVQHVFFHASAGVVRNGRQPTFPVGAQVRFRLVRGEPGPQCADIELVELGGNSLLCDS
jgi:cold shock CspA family protein